MDSSRSVVLVFGDQTDDCQECFDRIIEKSAIRRNLRRFIEDVTAVVRMEFSKLSQLEQQSIGEFVSLAELSRRLSRGDELVSHARIVLVYITRAALVLELAEVEPHLVIPNDGPNILSPQLLWICGGLLNALAVAASHDFTSLYTTSVEMAGLVCRLCHDGFERAIAVEDDTSLGADWGWSIAGVERALMRAALDKFHGEKRIPEHRRIQIAVKGEGWDTISGPPSVLVNFLASADIRIRNAPKQPLKIKGLAHGVSMMGSNVEYLMGHDIWNKSLRQLVTESRDSCVPSIVTGNATALCSLFEAALAALLDTYNVEEALHQLSSKIAAVSAVDLITVGPCGQLPYYIHSLEGAGKRIRVQELDKAWHQLHYPSPSQGRISGTPDGYSGRKQKIAIVGMAGRAPSVAGGSSTSQEQHIEEYWKIMMAGESVHREIPPDRFSLEEYYSESHAGLCTTSVKHGCFIDKPGLFDERFFSVSPREATLLEPTQRNFLMCVYEALEMAGYTDCRSRGDEVGTPHQSRIGTFLGLCSHDYSDAVHPQGCSPLSLMCLARSFGSGRVNFHFGWEGPAYSLDQACSSSASAVQLACMHLTSRECDMAVAGGSNLLPTPHTFSILSKAGFLSTSGGCKFLRADADGYCRGEFVGAVALKRLEDAVAGGDNILGVISASSRNHSGNAPHLTHSDPGAQQRLFEKVLAQSNLYPEDIDYVEMHGTGTQVGDVAEATAVANVFGQPGSKYFGRSALQYKKRRAPLHIGSVKANIGHSEASAGVASIIKALCMFNKEIIPPLAGMPAPLNPKLPDLSELGIQVPSEPVGFTSSTRANELNGVSQTVKPRRIVVNSFDATGGATCLIIEEPPSAEPPRMTTGSQAASQTAASATATAHVFVTSARSSKSHQGNKQRLLRYLRDRPDISISDLAYTTTARRQHHKSFRTAYVASTIQEAIEKMDADLGRDEPGAMLKASGTSTTSASKSPVVFVFTGQPSHYAGMGRRLYLNYPVFRRVVERCVQLASDQGFPPFLDLITSNDADVTPMSTLETQLATVTVEAALTIFWSSLGVEPDVVVGHSLGEYAALHAAKVLSLADMLYLVGRRAQLILERCQVGEFSMLAVAAPASQLEKYLGDYSRFQIACHNGPSATVVGGRKVDIQQLQDRLQKSDNIRSQELPVPFGFHSEQIEPALEELVTVANGVSFASPRTPVASTLTGDIIEPGRGDVFNGAYLARQARETVLFTAAIFSIQSHLADSRLRPFWLEVGATPICGPFVRAIVKSPLVYCSLKPGCDDRALVATALAALYEAGVDIDWPVLHQPFRSQLRLLTLPTYAWDLKNHWVTQTRHGDWTPHPKSSTNITVAAQPEFIGTRYTCLERVISGLRPDKSTADLIFSTSIDMPSLRPLVAGHLVLGVALCPASVFCEMAGAAVKFLLEQHDQHRKVENHADGESTNNDLRVVLLLRDMSLQRPTLLHTTNPFRTIITKVRIQNGKDNSFSVGFEQTSSESVTASARQTIGGCSVQVVKHVDIGKLQESWSEMGYFIKARCDVLVNDALSHRFDPSIFYALFSATVDYTEAFQGLRQAHVSRDFREAVAEISLRPDPEGTYFNSSPYHHDSIAHLAGFLLNSNPSRPRGVIYMLNGIKRSVSAEPLVPGSSIVYTVYARVVMATGDDFYCNVYGFKDGKMILETVGLHFREVSVPVAERVLGKNNIAQSNMLVDRTTDLGQPVEDGLQQPRSLKPAMWPVVASTSPSLAHWHGKTFSTEPAAQPPSFHRREKSTLSAAETAGHEATFDAVLKCIGAETGVEVKQLTDDLCLADLGIDSIMSMLITETLKRDLGIELPASSLAAGPTIGQLRDELSLPGKTGPAGAESEEPSANSSSIGAKLSTGTSQESFQHVSWKDTEVFQPEVYQSTVPDEYNGSSGLHPWHGVVHSDDNLIRMRSSNMTAETEDSSLSGKQSLLLLDKILHQRSNIPCSNIVLLQGRPSSDQTPLLLFADGSGSATTYIHWPRFKSNRPVYGVESACQTCPEEIPKIGGISGLAAKSVEAILKMPYTASRSSSAFRGFLLGGFSGGALVAYEAARQLTHAGHRVRGLLLMDMIAPRREAPPGGWDSEYDEAKECITPAEGMELLVRLAPPVGRAFWQLHMANKHSYRHQAEMIRAVARYHVPPLMGSVSRGHDAPPAEKSAIVWAQRSVLDRHLGSDDELVTRVRSRLQKMLEDRRAANGDDYNFMDDAELGPITWSYMPDRKLGPNGWEAFVGANYRCYVVDSDHYSMPIPPDVQGLGKAVEEAILYFSTDT